MARQTESSSAEEWRPLLDYESYYLISNAGRIRRIGMARLNGTGHGGARLGRVLKASPTNNGYLHVTLSGGGTRYSVNVHSLVAATFLGPLLPGNQINHRNGDKKDNHAHNLEYVTASENTRHADRLGLRRRGEAHWAAKLTTADVRVIRAEAGAGRGTVTRLAHKYGVDWNTIKFVMEGKTWTHVPQAK